MAHKTIALTTELRELLLRNTCGACIVYTGGLSFDEGGNVTNKSRPALSINELRRKRKPCTCSSTRYLAHPFTKRASSWPRHFLRARNTRVIALRSEASVSRPKHQRGTYAAPAGTTEPGRAGVPSCCAISTSLRAQGALGGSYVQGGGR